MDKLFLILRNPNPVKSLTLTMHDQVSSSLTHYRDHPGLGTVLGPRLCARSPMTIKAANSSGWWIATTEAGSRVQSWTLRCRWPRSSLSTASESWLKPSLETWTKSLSFMTIETMLKSLFCSIDKTSAVIFAIGRYQEQESLNFHAIKPQQTILVNHSKTAQTI